MATPASYGSSLVGSFSPPDALSSASPPGKALAYEQSRLSSIRQELERTKAMRRGMREFKYQSLVSLKRMQGHSENEISKSLPAPVHTPSPHKALPQPVVTVGNSTSLAAALPTYTPTPKPPSPSFRSESQRVEFFSTVQSPPPAFALASSLPNPPPSNAIRVDVHLAPTPTPSLNHSTSPHRSHRAAPPDPRSLSILGRATPRIGAVPVSSNALYDVHVVGDDLASYRRQPELLGDVSIGPRATAMLQAFRIEREGGNKGEGNAHRPRTGEEWMEVGRRERKEALERAAQEADRDAGRGTVAWSAATEKGHDREEAFSQRHSTRAAAGALPVSELSTLQEGGWWGGVTAAEAREARAGELWQGAMAPSQMWYLKEGVPEGDEESSSVSSSSVSSSSVSLSSDFYDDEEEEKKEGRPSISIDPAVEPASKPAPCEAEARRGGAHDPSPPKQSDDLNSIIDDLENDVLRQHEKLLALGLVDCELSFNSSVLGLSSSNMRSISFVR